jgi:hypothetical protein
MDGFHEIISYVQSGDIEYISRHAEKYFLTINDIIYLSVDLMAPKTLIWALNGGYNDAHVRYIAKYGSESLIKQLCLRIYIAQLYMHIILLGRYDIALILRSINVRLTDYDINQICKSGNVEAVKWIVQMGIMHKRRILNIISNCSNICSIEIVRYLTGA